MSNALTLRFCEEKTGFIAILFVVQEHKSYKRLRLQVASDSFDAEFGNVVPTLSEANGDFLIGFTLPIKELASKWRNKTPEQIAERLHERLKKML